MVKRHNHNNVITARSTTTQDIFSSNHSSQSISNQSTLQRKSDSARHHSRSTSNIESVSDVVREDTIDKVIKKAVSKIMSNPIGRVSQQTISIIVIP